MQTNQNKNTFSLFRLVFFCMHILTYKITLTVKLDAEFVLHDVILLLIQLLAIKLLQLSLNELPLPMVKLLLSNNG